MHSDPRGNSAGFTRSAWLLGLYCAFASGCGFHSDIGALGRLRTKIHDQVGSDASVNVHSAYGQTTVTIRLQHQPLGDPKQVQALVEALTKAEFPKTDYVVVLTEQLQFR